MFCASTLAIHLTFAPFMLNLYFYIVFGASTLAMHGTFAPVMQNLDFYIGFWAVPPAIPVTFAPLIINRWFYNVFSLSGLAILVTVNTSTHQFLGSPTHLAENQRKQSKTIVKTITSIAAGIKNPRFRTLKGSHHPCNVVT